MPWQHLNSLKYFKLMLPVHCLKQNPHIHFESASLFSGFYYIFVLLKQEFCSNE